MKLLRHGPAGAEKPGALDANGQARDLSLLIADFTPRLDVAPRSCKPWLPST